MVHRPFGVIVKAFKLHVGGMNYPTRYKFATDRVHFEKLIHAFKRQTYGFILANMMRFSSVCRDPTFSLRHEEPYVDNHGKAEAPIYKECTIPIRAKGC
jgi:hypothetical protein